MNPAFALAAFVDSPIVWAILALALLCYCIEIELLLTPPDAAWQQRSRTWLRVLPVLLGALPLLGLLGTIAGLLDTFRLLSGGGVDQQALLGGGIADALVTTQLGLVTAVAGLLLLALLRRRTRELRT